MTKLKEITVGALLVIFLIAAAFLIFGHVGHAHASGKPAGVGNADHVDTWHGTGDGHQANNEPGDTASDRHNFDDAATPGGVNPTDNGEGDGNG